MAYPKLYIFSIFFLAFCLNIANGADDPTEGTCQNSERISWTFDPDTKTLYFSTPGAAGYNLGIGEGCGLPTSFKSIVEKVVIGSGFFSLSSIFKQWTVLKEVDLTSSGLSFISSAFTECKKLESIVIPASVKSIGSYCFSKCESLKTLEFEKRDKELVIGLRAFEGCKSLTSVTLPKTATFSGSGVFSKCDKLSSFSLEQGHEEFAIGDDGFLYDINKEKLIQAFPALVPESLTLSVKDFEDYAFEGCSNLKSVSFQNGTRVIPYGMFSWCSRLSDVHLPDGLEEIGVSAFQDTAIADILIPDSVVTLGQSAFSRCSQLKSITVPPRVTVIPNSFCAQSHLSEVVIPEGVTEIGWHAFEGSHLITVDIPGSVSKISKKAFSTKTLQTLNYFGLSDPLVDETAFIDTSVQVNVLKYYEGDSFCTQPVQNVICKVSSADFKDEAWYVRCGSTMQDMMHGNSTLLNDYHFTFVQSESCHVFDENVVVDDDMEISLCKDCVLVSIEKESWLLSAGSAVGSPNGVVAGDATVLDGYFKKHHLMTLNNSEWAEVTETYVPEEDIQATLCNFVTIKQEKGKRWVVTNGSSITDGVVVGDRDLLLNLFEDYDLFYNDEEEGYTMISSGSIIEKDLQLVLFVHLTIDDSPKLFVMNGTTINDGFLGDSTIISQILPSMHLIDKKTWEEFTLDSVADHHMELVTCFAVAWQGIATGTVFVQPNSTLSSVSGLATYLQSEKYLVVDLSENFVVSGETVVSEEYHISIFERPVAVVVVFKTEQSSVRITDMLSKVCRAIGTSNTSVFVEFVSETSSHETACVNIFIVKEEERETFYEKIKETMMEQYGIEKVFIEGSSSKSDEKSLDSCGRNDAIFTIIALFTFVAVILTHY